MSWQSRFRLAALSRSLSLAAVLAGGVAWAQDAPPPQAAATAAALRPAEGAAARAQGGRALAGDERQARGGKVHELHGSDHL